MSAAARIGDSVTTGHGCDAITSILLGSSNVFINGSGAARLGDILAPHTILVPGIPPRCVPHSAVVNSGSSTVRVNGIPLARVGDSADFGAIITGSGNVNAG